MDSLLTVEEAANVLKVREDTIRRWLREGTLHGRKLNRVWRIPQSELIHSAHNQHDDPQFADSNKLLISIRSAAARAGLTNSPDVERLIEETSRELRSRYSHEDSE